MKTKSIISFLILLLFAILGSGSFTEGELKIFGIMIVVAVIVGIVMGLLNASDDKEAAERLQKNREEELKAKTEAYNNQMQQFLTLNGTPDKTIILEKLDLSSEIHVYEKSKKVFILGKEYAFKDVISCTFSDSPRIVKGKITAVTKSKNGSVIGRSIVGDVVAGPAGAIIGGVTAKKNTEYIQEDDKTIHDYTVIINMNSISDPIIRIHTGEKGRLTNEIVGLMNVIISRK